jgi:hypothetical protein
MTFSKSSYFAGVGSVFAAIALGFAGGAMITGGTAVQPPNRVERVAAGEALQKSSGQPAAASDPQPVAQQPAPATASSEAAPAPNIQWPPSTPAVMAKGDEAASANTRQSPPAPATTARSDDALPVRNDQAGDRTAEWKKAAERKRVEERKFAERRKRQDIEQAANAVRQMKRDGVIDPVVQRDEAPRFEAPRFGFFGNDDN